MAGQVILQIMHALVFMLHGLYNKWYITWLMEALKVRCLLISWWRFLMPAAMQDWKLLPLHVTWATTVSRSSNIWIFLRRHLSSGFRIKKLHLYPHPLKFTHNIFLKHDVANVEYVITRNGKRLTSATKWEVYWRCMKLTDVLCIACCSKSLKPCTHSAKTVSLPVPIISSSYQHSCHSKDNCTLRVEWHVGLSALMLCGASVCDTYKTARMRQVH